MATNFLLSIFNFPLFSITFHYNANETEETDTSFILYNDEDHYEHGRLTETTNDQGINENSSIGSSSKTIGTTKEASTNDELIYSRFVNELKIRKNNSLEEQGKLSYFNSQPNMNFV